MVYTSNDIIVISYHQAISGSYSRRYDETTEMISGSYSRRYDETTEMIPAELVVKRCSTIDEVVDHICKLDANIDNSNIYFTTNWEHQFIWNEHFVGDSLEAEWSTRFDEGLYPDDFTIKPEIIHKGFMAKREAIKNAFLAEKEAAKVAAKVAAKEAAQRAYQAQLELEKDKLEKKEREEYDRLRLKYENK